MNEEIQEARAEAAREHRHQLYLMKDMELWHPVGEVPTKERGLPKKEILGFAVACWLCGLTYKVTSWKTLVRWRCGMFSICAQGTPAASSIDRFRINSTSLQDDAFSKWLAELNNDASRSQMHWPQLCRKEDPERRTSVAFLQCVKCGQTADFSRKKVFLNARCEPQELPVDHVCAFHQEAERGGLRMATLNVGSLKGKEALLSTLSQDVWSLQEVAVPASVRPTVTSAFKNEQASIVYGSDGPFSYRQPCQRNPPKSTFFQNSSCVSRLQIRFFANGLLFPSENRFFCTGLPQWDRKLRASSHLEFSNFGNCLLI